MITKRHLVTLIINGKEAELYSQEDINLRINNVIYNPSKITTSTAEYSFSFELPKCSVNNQIFDNANDHAKVGKFGKNYSCEVYADGELIFSGTLRLKSIEADVYKCNLVSIKQNKIEDIFGDHKMNELKWYIPFVGIDSINITNQSDTSDYFFPFVSYGCFQKEPEAKYGDVNVYTGKFDLDKTLMIYQETFPPSPKITTLIKKLFEQYGYVADGDIFSDEIADKIYLSEYLKDDQDPSYNIGGSSGKCTVNFSAKNMEILGTSGYTLLHGDENTLTYGYAPNASNRETKNFNTVHVYDVWNMANFNSSRFHAGEVSTDNPWLFRNNCIVIPATGLYKVTLGATVSIFGHSFKAGVYSGYNDDIVEITVNPTNIWGEATPVELQIVRNENEVELIHGYNGTDKTVYPHEAGPESIYPSSGGGRNPGRNPGGGGGINPGGGRPGGGRPGGGRRDAGRGDRRPTANSDAEWYIPQQYQMMHYDPYVSPNFVCGLSSIGRCFSFMKNYNSWATADGLVTTQFQSIGYDKVRFDSSGPGDTTSTERSDYHQQNSIGAPANNLAYNSTSKYTGQVSGIFYFNKNDIIMCKAVLRKYMESPNASDNRRTRLRDYGFEITNGRFHIEALSPNEDYVSNVSTGAWGLKTQFDTDLNIGEFLNAEEKISDFVNNFVRMFNLSVTQEGNTIFLNKQSQNLMDKKVPVDLDDRVDIRRCTAEPIEYPKSMQVKFNIDDEEAGFYNSVPNDHINDDDWKDWADIGSEKVMLDEYNESADDEEVSLSMSYCWYMPFKLRVYSTTPGKEDVETWSGNVNLPVISKDEYMIENYKMEESMENDGKGQRQRMWFRTIADKKKYLVDNVYGKQIYLAIPKGTDDNGFELSYKNKPDTLLTRYFNILAMPNSNLISVEAYLTPSEYMRIKNGAPIKVGGDIYITCEIKGYDPTGNNTTEIIAMKKM